MMDDALVRHPKRHVRRSSLVLLVLLSLIAAIAQASLHTPTQGQLRLPIKISSPSSLTEPSTPRTWTPKASCVAPPVSPSSPPQLPRDGPHWYGPDKVADIGSQHNILELFGSMLEQMKPVVDQFTAMERKRLRVRDEELPKSTAYSGATSGPGDDGQGAAKSSRAPQAIEDGSPGETRRAISRLVYLLEQARKGLDAAKAEANDVDIELRTLRQRNKSLTSRLNAEKEMVAYVQAQRRAQREKSQRNAIAYRALEGRVKELHEDHQTQCRRYEDELVVQRYEIARLSEANHSLQGLLRREQEQRHEQDREMSVRRRKNEQLMEAIRVLRQEQQHPKQWKSERDQAVMAQKNANEGLTRTTPALRRQQQQRCSQGGGLQQERRRKHEHRQGWQVSTQPRKSREAGDTVRTPELKQHLRQQRHQGEWRLEELLQKQLQELSGQKSNHKELLEIVSRLKQQ